MTIHPPLLLDWQTQIFGPATSVVVIGIVAIVMLLLAMKVTDKLLPFDVRKELEEDHNVAAAIVMAAIVVGVALVIAAVARG